jgi:hypothetical protein
VNPSRPLLSQPLDRRKFLKTSIAVGTSIAAFGLSDFAIARGSCLWGANCQPSGGENQIEALSDMERRLGRKFGTTHHRLGWDDPLVNTFSRWSVSTGHVPIISWSTHHSNVTWDSIARGVEDDWIRTQAQALKVAGWSGYFCFHKEPENEGNATDWKAAFDHVHNVFDNVGVTGFRWVACLTAATYGGLNGGPDVWMPDDFDLLGVDGANRGGSKWRTFEQIYAPAHTYATSRGEQLYIPEYGCVEGGSNRKAQWITDARATIKGWPEVIGVSYLDENTDGDFRIDTSTSAFNAFKAMGKDAYYA